MSIRRLDQEHADRTDFRAIGRVIAPWGRRIGDLRFETEGAWKRSGSSVEQLAQELRLALQYPEGAGSVGPHGTVKACKFQHVSSTRTCKRRHGLVMMARTEIADFRCLARGMPLALPYDPLAVRYYGKGAVIVLGSRAGHGKRASRLRGALFFFPPDIFPPR